MLKQCAVCAVTWNIAGHPQRSTAGRAELCQLSGCPAGALPNPWLPEPWSLIQMLPGIWSKTWKSLLGLLCLPQSWHKATKDLNDHIVESYNWTTYWITCWLMLIVLLVSFWTHHRIAVMMHEPAWLSWVSLIDAGWRGGMRSGSMAWLFSLCGFEVERFSRTWRI